MELGVTARRAGRITGISSASPCREKAPAKSRALLEALKEVWRPNMGYRMDWGFLREEFAPFNVKRVHRIWKEERMGRMKRYRKKRTGDSLPLAAAALNEVRCLDFCYDACPNGTMLEVLAIVDSPLFVGNLSRSYAVAARLKRRVILGADRRARNFSFYRPNELYAAAEDDLNRVAARL
jgi:hypothetical protein